MNYQKEILTLANNQAQIAKDIENLVKASNSPVNIKSTYTGLTKEDVELILEGKLETLRGNLSETENVVVGITNGITNDKIELTKQVGELQSQVSKLSKEVEKLNKKKTK